MRGHGRERGRHAESQRSDGERASRHVKYPPASRYLPVSPPAGGVLPAASRAYCMHGPEE